jgi:hypothetical protein
MLAQMVPFKTGLENRRFESTALAVQTGRRHAWVADGSLQQST